MANVNLATEILDAWQEVNFTAGSALTAGDPVNTPGLVCIAKADYASGADAAGVIAGLMRGSKVNEAMAIGDILGWDSDADPYGGTAGTGAWTVAASNWDSGYRNLAMVVATSASGTYSVDFVLLPKVFGPEVGIQHHTADDTLTEEDVGVFHTNLGATGAVTLTLDQTAAAGTRYEFGVMTAQQLRVDPGAAGAVYINGAKQTDNKYVWADDEAESIVLIADGNGDWLAAFETGTWTVET